MNNEIHIWIFNDIFIDELVFYLFTSFIKIINGFEFKK